MSNSDSTESSTKPHFVWMAIFAVAGIGFVMLATNGFSDPTADSIDAGRGEAKAIVPITENSNDCSVPLTGNNTDIKWTGSNSIGQTPTGYFYKLDGNIAFDQSSKKLKHFNVIIDMDGVKAMSTSLTKKLKHKGFFEVGKYPQATFVSTSIEYEPSADHEPGPYACVVEGNFQLRDVTQSIKIPLEVSDEGAGIQLTSKFKINRKDYGVVYSDSTTDKLIRDSVLIEISIDAKRHLDQPTAATEKIENDTSDLTNQLTTPHASFTETIDSTLVEFEMIFVPGEKATGVKPFCIGKTEVTWSEFDFWALCKNMTDKDSINEISQQLRPSSPHDLEKIYRGWGRENQPVVGISRRSAELYCQWLSEQTGKKYRLPTSAEWDHAFVLGGRELDATSDSENLAEIAWFDENALSTDDEGFDFERAMPVAKLKPNGLGIHDMLGNASEWVSDSDDNQIVRGGHFKLSADELKGAHVESEDQNVWNKDYPQDPKSKWWYVNADYVGFRVVCELE